MLRPFCIFFGRLQRSGSAAAKRNIKRMRTLNILLKIFNNYSFSSLLIKLNRERSEHLVMIKEFQPLDKCKNPVRIVKSDGVHFYRCGRCLSCVKAKQSLWRERLVHAIHSHAATLFITLHYDNYNLPLAAYDPNTLEIKYLSRTKWNRKTKQFERFYDCNPDYDVRSALIELPNGSSLPHYVRSRTRDVITYDDSSTLNFCSKNDVQDFVKRLRAKLSRDSSLSDYDYSFTYFICAEYGPKTYRPHYHGLLFFNDIRVAEKVRDELCFDAWGKTNICSYEKEPMCKLVTSANGAASYVSKYITVSSVVPSCFTAPCFKTFYLFSKKTPLGSDAFDVASVPGMLETHSIMSHHEYIEKRTAERISYDVPFPSSCWNRIFPKFVFLDLLPSDAIYYIFRFLYQWRGRDLPNLREEMRSRYGIGDIRYIQNVDVCKPFYNWHLIDLFRCPSHINFGLSPSEMWSAICGDSPQSINESFRFYNYAPERTYRVSVGSVFGQLFNDPDFWYLYLFGIPQNRAACRKIIAAFDTYQWCSDVLTYADFYLKYSSVNFSLAYGMFNEQRNYLLAQGVTASLLFYLYPYIMHYFDKGSDNVTDEFYNSIFPKFQIMYNIDYEHFCSTLRPFDYRDSQIYHDYWNNLCFRHNHNISVKLHKHERIGNF